MKDTWDTSSFFPNTVIWMRLLCFLCNGTFENHNHSEVLKKNENIPRIFCKIESIICTVIVIGQIFWLCLAIRINNYHRRPFWIVKVRIGCQVKISPKSWISSWSDIRNWSFKNILWANSSLSSISSTFKSKSYNWWERLSFFLSPN